MSDSSDDEDLSRFKDVVDTSFTKLIEDSLGNSSAAGAASSKNGLPAPKSERYLEESNHYNDVKVPAEKQKQIGSKVSAIINKNIEFVDVPCSNKKTKIKGGVKLFKDSEDFLTCEEAEDISTAVHNEVARRMKREKIDNSDNLKEEDKIKAAAITGEFIQSKQEIKLWKSRRKEKLFKYKASGKSKVLTAVE